MDERRPRIIVSSSAGFVTLLQIAFIVLKLCKVIGWSWPIVLLPLIITASLNILLLIIAIIVGLLVSSKQ